MRLLLKIDRDFKLTEIPERVQALSEALETQINSPHPTHQENVGVALNDVLSAIENSEIESFSPAWIQMIEELGFRSILGYPLSVAINDAFRGAEIVPTITRDIMIEIAHKLDALKKSVSKGIESLSGLNIGTDELASGSCEIGFLIPRKAIEFRLDLFAEECDVFDRLFGTFSELATGERHHYKIKTISSSDLSVFLETCIPVGAAIAIAMERILEAYKKILEIKKLRSELAATSIPEKAFKEIDQHAADLMEKNIQTIAKDMVKNSNVKLDQGRKNELENSLRIALRKLANRVDRGFHIEVRVGPDPEEEKDEPSKEDAAQIQKIRKLSAALQFISPVGVPILALPESDPDDSSNTSSKRTSGSSRHGKNNQPGES